MSQVRSDKVKGQVNNHVTARTPVSSARTKQVLYTHTKTMLWLYFRLGLYWLGWLLL